MRLGDKRFVDPHRSEEEGSLVYMANFVGSMLILTSLGVVVPLTLLGFQYENPSFFRSAGAAYAFGVLLLLYFNSWRRLWMGCLSRGRRLRRAVLDLLLQVECSLQVFLSKRLKSVPVGDSIGSPSVNPPSATSKIASGMALDSSNR